MGSTVILSSPVAIEVPPRAAATYDGTGYSRCGCSLAWFGCRLSPAITHHEPITAPGANNLTRRRLLRQAVRSWPAALDGPGQILSFPPPW